MAELKAYRRKYLNKLVSPTRWEYVLTLKNIGTVSAEDVIKEAAGHCRLQESDISAAFGAITQAMMVFLQLGHGVQLPSIGSLQPSIRAKAVATEEECTQATLKGSGINITMKPIGSFKKSVETLRIKIVKSTTDDTAVEGDDESSSGSGSGSSGSSGSGSSGSGSSGSGSSGSGSGGSGDDDPLAPLEP